MIHANPTGSEHELASSAAPPVPIHWPAGKTAAACLTFDLDAEAAVLTADIGSLRRMTPMSHQSYGPLVGVPRILALLGRHGLKAPPRTCPQPILPADAYWITRPVS